MIRLTALPTLFLLTLLAEVAEGKPPYIVENKGYELRSNGSIQRFVSRDGSWDDYPHGLIRSVAYDLEGKSTEVSQGKGNLWEIVSVGPEQIYLRAAQGKLKRWFLVVEGGRLKLSQKPQLWYVTDPRSGK